MSSSEDVGDTKTYIELDNAEHANNDDDDDEDDDGDNDYDDEGYDDDTETVSYSLFSYDPYESYDWEA
ncbi:unnamed protein product [Didymodactylos carnosus]|uniref:Uncharacterized protein n=1 Tax=Didymodactylos carnosus TaxID=1234261 RepID=A0A815LL93_9BILA|nr:unnamed protein product [Didymodactylos carnosus]CAF4299130.1 unnamed protein product [Didymodactylos carnosus]